MKKDKIKDETLETGTTEGKTFQKTKKTKQKVDPQKFLSFFFSRTRKSTGVFFF
jgi:hypothetical protein